MKKAIYFFIILFLFLASNFCFAFSSPPPPIKTYLLTTEWDQAGEYAKFAPNGTRLGCWSTAVAQILYYHRLSPTGEVDYTASDGTRIKENLGSHKFNWSEFVDSFQYDTQQSSIDAVAMYSYLASLVMQKDWTTMSYCINSRRQATAIAEHYNCETAMYDTSRYQEGQIRMVIEDEIRNKRPVMLYLYGGHAIVVDGYYKENGHYFIHCNMGWGGFSNGWYDWFDPIQDYNVLDKKLIFTIKPKKLS